MTTPPTEPLLPRAEAVIDLDAISANVEALRSHAGGRELMAVVKADAYGHGIVESAGAARRGGAQWLGVALLEEALRLRSAGDTGQMLSWLAVPGERYDLGIEADVEMSAYSAAQLDDIADAAASRGRRGRVQLKLDSGLSRGGCRLEAWPALVDAAVRRRDAGHVDVTGVWSHFACSDAPDHPSVKAQLADYEDGVGYAVGAGLEPVHLHFANSAAALEIPASWGTMIRPGIALYGVSPFADGHSPVDLVPAMTLRGAVALVKAVPAGQGVSYGHTYVTTSDTRVALVPLGYGDGIPRAASSRGPLALNGRLFKVAGRVCMDQLVIDIGDHPAGAGDEVVVFGDPAQGAPSAHDWAAAADTIGYEIVTRIGSRVPRRYAGEGA